LGLGFWCCLGYILWWCQNKSFLEVQLYLWNCGQFYLGFRLPGVEGLLSCWYNQTHIYVAILLMSQGCTTYHPCSYLVRSIKAFEEQGGQFVWLHSLRETNQAADKLTKFGLDLGRELRIFEFVTQFFYRMLF